MPDLPVRQPCASCPWRIGNDAWAVGRDIELSVPPLHYNQMLELFRSQGRGFGGSIMACHLTFKGEEAIEPHHRTRVGYALSVEGGDNLTLRMLAIKGEVDSRAYSSEAPLHSCFAEMIQANPPRREALVRHKEDPHA